MKSRKVQVRELLAPLIISQASRASGGGVGVDLAFVLALGRKKKKKKLDKAKILKMLWSLKMIRKLDSLRGEIQLGQ